MKILIVASDKGNHFVPFIEEQMAALAQEGIEVERFGIKRKGLCGYLREIPRLCRTIREVHPDLLHAHYGLSGLLAGLARLVCLASTSLKRGLGGVPLVTTYHGSDINDPRVLRLSCLAMRLSAWNIFVSKRNVDIAAKACRITNYSLIPCGVNLTDDQLHTREEARRQLSQINLPCIVGNGKERKTCAFHDIQDASIILFAGAFDNAVKDAPLAQQSMDVLNADVPFFEGGRGSLIELRGYSRTEVNLLMCAADCLLLTSKREGSPQVIKEAMVCGCPIVSVDVGDVSERIADLDGCFLARTRDPQEIANLLAKALAHKGKTQGRQRIIDEELSNKQIARSLIHLYNSIINDRKWLRVC